jgi:hypothetical protein
MQTLKSLHGSSISSACFLLIALPALVAGCSSGSSSSVTVDGDVSIAYVKRPVSSVGNPTDAITFTPGGDLYIREKSDPNSPEINVTASLTQGQGDVSDPEVSYDGSKLLFSMRRATDPGWRVWEYDIARKTFTQISCTATGGTTPPGDDVDPAYLPDNRIVFVSNRQIKSRQLMTEEGMTPFAYLDEYERERTTALHVMNSNGSDCHQISSNQSHDRNPTVLQTGEIMYSRWDHVGGRNQFSIFFTNPDGTNLFVLYGAHSPGNSYLHPRELPNGQVLSSLMPLSRTHEGGALMRIDVKNYSENCEPAPGVPGGCNGQLQPTAKQVNFGRGISINGRFSAPYPLWDGSNRALVSWTPSCAATNSCVMAANPLTGIPEPSDEQTPPVYGIYMLDLNTGNTRPVVTAPAGYAVLDAVAIQPRPLPNVISDKSLTPALASKVSQLSTTGVGILNVKSVYDTDSQGRMGAAVLVAGESIPMTGGVADLATLKDPALRTAAQRPARFMRVTRAIPTQSGISREAIGETMFEMQQILGYVPIEPDGSFKIEVPADIPVALTAVDSNGRGFQTHTNWIQVRPGETRTCNGCHSPRRGNAINTGLTPADLDTTSGLYYHRNTLLGIGVDPVTGTLPTGQSMAETLDELARRGNATAVAQQPTTLKQDIKYLDYWTDATKAGRAADAPFTIDYSGVPVAPANGMIDYPTHIQPIWNRARASGACISCHQDPATLDLRDTTAGTGRLTSYEELMVGDPVLDANGLPVIEVQDDELVVVRGEAQVNVGLARGSHLIEVLFNQELRSDLPISATTPDHSAMLNASEKRLVSEWIDVGGQYYNSPRDGAGGFTGNLRGVTGLDENAFHTADPNDRDIHAILLDRCGACHQAVGQPGSGGAPNGGYTGARYVLTGQAEGDFNATLSMIGDISNPPMTELLRRPASAGTNPTHAPGPILPVGDPDYNAICNWIQAGFCP